MQRNVWPQIIWNPCLHQPCWKHITIWLLPNEIHPQPMASQHKKKTLTLCVYEFVTKYFLKDDAHHLIYVIKSNYEVTINWNGSLYIDSNMDWNYTESPAHVNLSMKGFVDQSQTKFDHPIPKKPQHAPHPWTTKIYGQKTPQLPSATNT